MPTLPPPISTDNSLVDDLVPPGMPVRQSIGMGFGQRTRSGGVKDDFKGRTKLGPPGPGRPGLARLRRQLPQIPLASLPTVPNLITHDTAVAAAHEDAGVGTTLTTTTFTSVAGQVAFASYNIYNGGAGSSFVSLVDSKGNTWVPVGTEQVAAPLDNLKGRLYYSILTNVGASHTLTLTISANAQMCLFVDLYSNLAPSSIEDGNNALILETTRNTSWRATTLATTNANDLVIGWMANGNGFVMTPGTGWSKGSTHEGAAWFGGGMIYTLSNIAGDQTPYASYASPDSGIFGVAAFKALAPAISTTYTATVSGGMTFASTAPHAIERIGKLLGGGLLFAGTAVLLKLKIGAVSGGLLLASTAARLKLKIGAVSGGAIFAGAATTTNYATFVYLPTGGLTLASTAPVLKLKIGAVSGGALLAGTAPRLRQKVSVGSGGAVFAGAAATTLNELFIYQPTGGLTLGTRTGGTVTSGPAITAVLTTTTFIPTWRPRRFR